MMLMMLVVFLSSLSMVFSYDDPNDFIKNLSNSTKDNYASRRLVECSTFTSNILILIYIYSYL